MTDKKPTEVILITGAARRIGAELSRFLHQSGYRIILHFHTSEAEALALSQELNNDQPDSCLAIRADLHHLNEVEQLANSALRQWGRIDVLINNASRFYPGLLGEVTADIWDDLMNANLRAPFFLSQALADELRYRRGCIINLVDIHSERPLKDHTVYSLSKAGMAMLTKSLARELGPDVRVNGISPGAVLWPEAELSANAKADILDKTALKHPGSPQDICRTALFLIEQADYISGQILAVDGGRNLNQ